jgi:DNA-binding MarR family transcriptional regulator
VPSKKTDQILELLKMQHLAGIRDGEHGGPVLVQQHLQVAALLERVVSATAGLNVTDVMVLDFMHRVMPDSAIDTSVEPKDIATATGYSVARVSESIRRLDARSYVRRVTPKKRGAGKRWVALTEAGRKSAITTIRKLDEAQLVLSMYAYKSTNGRSAKLMIAAARLTLLACAYEDKPLRLPKTDGNAG